VNETILVEGVVFDTSDPHEMGRLRIWCPSIDGEIDSSKVLPWAQYVSPLAGAAYGYPAGGSGTKSVGPVAYGFWALPKIGAKVLVAILYGDYNQRVYLGSFFDDFGNRSLPTGRNNPDGTLTSDSGDIIEPANSLLKAQFAGDLTNSISKTRGAYERQVGQPADTKTPDEGYGTRGVSEGMKDIGTLDPQTYCITTPGRHAIIMQDEPKFARVRVKTAEGHQVILDDANERIYVSTAGGKTWFEMDKDGHVHVYGAESISMSTGGDFNISAIGNINLSAGKNVNIAAAGAGLFTACEKLSLTGNGVDITSGDTMNILASGWIHQTGSEIHLNGPGATTAACAGKPSITPSTEPWTRPATTGTRGTNWKA
jgi:phage gp45-like